MTFWTPSNTVVIVYGGSVCLIVLLLCLLWGGHNAARKRDTSPQILLGAWATLFLVYSGARLVWVLAGGQ